MMNVMHNNWSLNFNPFYIPNRPFSRLLSVSLISCLPFKYFLHSEYAVFSHKAASQQISLLTVPLGHTTSHPCAHSDPSHSLLPDHLW